MKIKLFIILLCTITITACVPDPRREASAFETRALAEQQALDMEQARAQKEALDAVTLRDAEHTQDVKDTTLTNAQRVLGSRIVAEAFALTVVMIILAFGLGTSHVLVGTGRAVAIAAEFKANQVRLDPVTRQYPLIRQVHGSRWMIENPNTGQILFLDEKNEPDRMLIAAMAAVQHTGVMAREAENNNDVSIIQPLMLDRME